jgi:hypothetical protein
MADELNREDTIEGVRRAVFAYLTRYPPGSTEIAGAPDALVIAGVRAAVAQYLAAGAPGTFADPSARITEGVNAAVTAHLALMEFGSSKPAQMIRAGAEAAFGEWLADNEMEVKRLFRATMQDCLSRFLLDNRDDIVRQIARAQAGGGA